LEEEDEELDTEQRVNIILYPSQDEVDTDEDSDEDEGEMSQDPNHLGKGILSQQAELENFDEELPDITRVNSDGDTVDILDESAGPPKKKPCRRTRAATKDTEEEEEEDAEEEEDEEDNGPGLAKKLDR
jgi:hypothetical protein